MLYHLDDQSPRDNVRLMRRNRYNMAPQRNLDLRDESNKGKEKPVRPIRRADIEDNQRQRMAVRNPVQENRAMTIDTFPTQHTLFLEDFDREIDHLRMKYNL
jgi:hypothetical protein